MESVNIIYIYVYIMCNIIWKEVHGILCNVPVKIE
jgi:hypothetical protein